MNATNRYKRSWFIIKKDIFKNITTEIRNENTKDIDILSTIDLVNIINIEDSKITKAIKDKNHQIELLIDAAYSILKNGGRMFYIGAGTSGRLGVLDASEMPPTFNVDNNVIIGLIAGGDKALREPIEGAEDSLTESIKQLEEKNFCKNDFLIGIAASGRTPYVCSGLEYANRIGAKTGSISTSKNTTISALANYPIEILVGPEVITGSTRMKSGTAQKMVLNIISSSVMIKMGKVYSNLMVDVRPTNEKLIERSISIVMEITGMERVDVLPTLEETGFYPKLSIVMIMKKISIDDARTLLEKNNGKLRSVI